LDPLLPDTSKQELRLLARRPAVHVAFVAGRDNQLLQIKISLQAWVSCPAGQKQHFYSNS
jgi:hypothetical protein